MKASMPTAPAPISPDWPDNLDALVAAPAQHTLLFENERVRVLHTHIAAGERTPVHSHRWPSVYYVLSWSHFIRYDKRGTELFDSRQADEFKKVPTVVWVPPLQAHATENIGPVELSIIAVELKSEMHADFPPTRQRPPAGTS
jgi:mannose-6-phosphate isomerase-like protein (cupin superfamily)